jgi:UDPglucose 6-dehydrogenase
VGRERAPDFLGVLPQLLREGAQVVAYDPKAMQKARSIKAIADAEFASSALEAVTDAEALIIATDWNEFANVDFAVLKDKMRTPIVFDGRNLLDPETMRQFGFNYYSIGRVGVRAQ